MNKLELIEVISKQLSLTKKDCKNVIDAFLEHISLNLKEGNKVVLSNFGVFETREVQSHYRFHPQTGEKILNKYPVRLSFRPSDKLKQIINGVENERIYY